MYIYCLHICSVLGNKPKWLPYEIELPKTRRRPMAGRPRASSQEHERSRATPESSRETHDGPRSDAPRSDGPRSGPRDGGRRREGRGGGRDSSERTTTGNARRNRREPGDSTAQSSEDHRESVESNKTTPAEIPHSDKGLGCFFYVSPRICMALLDRSQGEKFWLKLYTSLYIVLVYVSVCLSVRSSHIDIALK